MEKNEFGWSIVCDFTEDGAEPPILSKKMVGVVWHEVDTVMREMVESIDTLGLTLMQFYVYPTTEQEVEV